MGTEPATSAGTIDARAEKETSDEKADDETDKKDDEEGETEREGRREVESLMYCLFSTEPDGAEVSAGKVDELKSISIENDQEVVEERSNTAVSSCC